MCFPNLFIYKKTISGSLSINFAYFPIKLNSNSTNSHNKKFNRIEMLFPQEGKARSDLTNNNADLAITISVSARHQSARRVVQNGHHRDLNLLMIQF